MRVLGALFRRLFLTRLIKLHDAGKLVFFGAHADLADQRRFLRHLAPVRKKRWVVYAKAPFSGPEAVLAYRNRCLCPTPCDFSFVQRRRLVRSLARRRLAA